MTRTRWKIVFYYKKAYLSINLKFALRVALLTGRCSFWCRSFREGQWGGWMDGWMIHQLVFRSYFLVPMGKMQLLWLRVMMPFIRKSLKAAHFVSQFFVRISFFKNFEIFHHNWGQNRNYIRGTHIFFHCPQTIGFRLIMREISRQCRLLFYCFFSSLPLLKGKYLEENTIVVATVHSILFLIRIVKLTSANFPCLFGEEFVKEPGGHWLQWRLLGK